MYTDIILGSKTQGFEEIRKKLRFDNILELREAKIIISDLKDYEKARSLITSKRIGILLNPHLQEKKDQLHFRLGGLDQAICKELSTNNIPIAFTLDSLNNHTEIGRAMQNIKLCRKYKIKMFFFTFAKIPYELRAVNDLISFLKILGMTEQEARYALQWKS